MRNAFIKPITLLVFVALISAFVGYRSGLADKFLQRGGSKHYDFSSFQQDTIPEISAVAAYWAMMASSRVMMPSSKSLIISEPLDILMPKSTLKVDPTIMLKLNSMESSKSVFVKRDISADSVHEN